MHLFIYKESQTNHEMSGPLDLGDVLRTPPCLLHQLKLFPNDPFLATLSLGWCGILLFVPSLHF